MERESSNKARRTEQEDRFLKQQIDLGLTGRTIYERYGELLNRTDRAIENRVSYLKNPPKKQIEQTNPEINLTKEIDRVCNRLDTLINYQEKILEKLDEIEQQEDSRCDSYIKALYEMKASVLEVSSNTNTIKKFAKRASQKMRF